MKTVSLAAAVSLFALAACGEPVDPSATDDTDLEVATTDGEAEALADALEAGDFENLQIGAMIEGPQGTEPTGIFANAQGNFGEIRSYVACPTSMDVCDPSEAPEDTVYTYVHVVYPGHDNNPENGIADASETSTIEQANAFKLMRPAIGFTGEVGYSNAEVRAAAGPAAQVVINCVDGGITWTVNSGDGGDQWEQSEPITFYWRSTVPPGGPAPAYILEANRTEATGPGPYPAGGSNAENATNACERSIPAAR
ncbi:hypothetical protein [Qipengyuania sp. JC766]|uniref:hypothetical protein n=1 Tax=Qipengyuania sp. JC766 TaxID=3232139 RepID=UPI00345910FC